jgi:hypothetical protein
VPLLRLVAPVLLAAALGGSSPSVVHRGQTVEIAATVGTYSGCLAHVQFADASGVDLGIKWPDSSRHVAWAYRIPAKAPLGPAQWSIRCGTGIYNYNGGWLIAPAGITVGPKPPPPVVSKQGFSQRPDAFGTGTAVSYGFLIRNPALKKDAKNVTVTISFVAGSGNVIGRKTVTVARVGAGETFALGGSTELGTQTDVKKLSASLRVGSYVKAVTMPRPRVASANIVDSTTDPGWVGEVDGELANDNSQHTLTRASVSIVVLDGSGRILGGGTGSLTRPLASGASGPFVARVGFAAIATSAAVRPVVSVVPSYR